MQVYVFDNHPQSSSPNEVFVRRGGTRMSPEPKFVVSGLKPDDEYAFKLRIELADDYKYTLQHDQWIPVASAGPNAHLSRITDVETVRRHGAHWHISVIRFEHMRLTSELSDLGKNMIYVEPGHQYVPVLSVVHTSSNMSVDIRFEQLQFVAMDHYSPRFYQPVTYFNPPYYHPPVQYYPVYQYVPVEQFEQVQPEPTEAEYVPEYGWNSVLMPDKGESVLNSTRDLFRHRIWAPREKELEKLYSKAMI